MTINARRPKPRKIATNAAINKLLRETGFYDAARQILTVGYGDVTVRITKARPENPRDPKDQYVVDLVTETSQRTVVKVK